MCFPHDMLQQLYHGKRDDYYGRISVSPDKVVNPYYEAVACLLQKKSRYNLHNILVENLM